MAKGAIAKQQIVEKLKSVFGDDYIGENSSKHYVWANDGGEKVQIAISLTCPKNPIGTVDMSSAFSDGIDFDAPAVVVQTKFEPAEITQEEQDRLQELMQKLGL